MIDSYLEQFAAGNILDALGIDWQMLIFQILGFAVLVWLMARYVYPPLIKAVDARQDRIEASAAAAKEAEERAARASQDIAEMIKQARDEAASIVSTAKDEANALIEESGARSQSQAERILASAREDISREVSVAKRELHNETVDLVTAATEKIVGKVIDSRLDDKLVAQAIKESK